MKISRAMHLGQLLDLLPDDATYSEADAMRRILAARRPGEDTGDIPNAEWLELWETASGRKVG